MSLAIRFVEVAGWDTESQEGASCYQLQYSYHFMREGKEVVSVERALDWCEVCRCDRAITCTVIYCSCASTLLWDSHGTEQLSLWKSIMLKTAGWCWCERSLSIFSSLRPLGFCTEIHSRGAMGELEIDCWVVNVVSSTSSSEVRFSSHSSTVVCGFLLFCSYLVQAWSLWLTCWFGASVFLGFYI